VLHRLSTSFIRTLREDPADAEVASHRLLVRACYVRRAAPGGYTWLPRGRRARDLASLFGNGEPPAPATTRRLKTPFQQVDEQDFEAGEQLVFICLPGLLDLVCQIDQIQTCKMS